MRVAIFGIFVLSVQGCAQPVAEVYEPPSLQTAANEACRYLGQGPTSPAYATCYRNVIRRFERR